MVESTKIEKHCRCCGEKKPLDDFHRHRGRKDGRTGDCKDCAIARAVKWQRTNPERHTAANKRWLEKNREYKKEMVKKWREENPDRVAAAAKRFRKRYPEKSGAHHAVEAAIERGQLERPLHCETCGGRGRQFKDGRASIHAHHDDYSKPLKVRWLCIDCHEAHHAEQDAQLNLNLAA